MKRNAEISSYVSSKYASIVRKSYVVARIAERKENMENKYTKKIAAGFTMIAAIGYSGVLFQWEKHFTVSEWTVYSFTMLAFLAVFMETLLARYSEKNYLIIRRPITFVTAIYFIVQILISLVVFLIPDVWNQKPIIGIEILWNLLCVIFYEIFRHSASFIEKQDCKSGEKIMNIRMMYADIWVIGKQCQNSELAQNILKIAEEIRYIDPMSSEKLAGIEERIWNHIGWLQEAVEDKDDQKTQKYIEKLYILLEERRQKCLAVKQ